MVQFSPKGCKIPEALYLERGDVVQAPFEQCQLGSGSLP